MSMVTPSTAWTPRLILWPPTSLSQTVPPPRSKWTLRLRMARSSLPLPRSSGGGIVAACCRLAGCGLIRRFRSAPVEFELSFFDARVRHVRGKSLHKLLRRSGRAKNVLRSIARKAETRGDRFLPHARNAARTDSRAEDARHPAEVLESGRARPALLSGRARSAANLSCTDCRDT